jgi:hypothetical protein
MAGIKKSMNRLLMKINLVYSQVNYEGGFTSYILKYIFLLYLMCFGIEESHGQIGLF